MYFKEKTPKRGVFRLNPANVEIRLNELMNEVNIMNLCRAKIEELRKKNARRI